MEDAGELGELTDETGFSVQDVGEGQDRYQIQNEPGLHVVAANFAPIGDEFLDAVVVGREEREDDVEKKDDIDSDVDSFPREPVFQERGLERRDDGRSKNDPTP